MAETQECVLKAVRKYNKEKTEALSLAFNRKTDADVIDVLEAQPNQRKYIRELIRSDIAREEGGKRCQQKQRKEQV